jgi:hypothetical protein
MVNFADHHDQSVDVGNVHLDTASLLEVVVVPECWQ